MIIIVEILYIVLNGLRTLQLLSPPFLCQLAAFSVDILDFLDSSSKKEKNTHKNKQTNKQTNKRVIMLLECKHYGVIEMVTAASGKKVSS